MRKPSSVIVFYGLASRQHVLMQYSRNQNAFAVLAVEDNVFAVLQAPEAGALSSDGRPSKGDDAN